MARDNQALVAPVGEAWWIVREERPDIALYADNTHPNPTGTYLSKARAQVRRYRVR